MAFSDYLVKIKGVGSGSDWTIPMKYIQSETYVALLSGQDLDSYRDSNGKLHRTALSNFAPKIEFEIPPMTNSEIKTFLDNIRSRYSNKTEKKLSATVYMPELDKYVTHDFYVPDINFTIYSIVDNEILYNATRVAFISYGGTV